MGLFELVESALFLSQWIRILVLLSHLECLLNKKRDKAIASPALREPAPLVFLSVLSLRLGCIRIMWMILNNVSDSAFPAI
jgi:hypothetical protein